MVANVYVNENVLVTVPGSRATYGTITQDIIDGIGYHYVRRFKGEFNRENADFFAAAKPRYAPPAAPALLGQPTTLTSNEYLCWALSPRDNGAFKFSPEIVEYYLRTLDISRDTASASASVTRVPVPSLSRLVY